MRNPTRALVVATVTMLALVGCTGTDGKNQPETTVTTATSPATTPTPVTTPSTSLASSQPTISTPSVDQALLNEALKVKREVLVYDSVFFKSGGLPPGDPPPELVDTMMETGLTKTFSSLRQVYDQQLDYQSGDIIVTKEKFADVPAQNGSIIALYSCEDGRFVISKHPDGKTSTGQMVLQTSWFKRDKDGTLKMNHWTSKKHETCA